MEQTFDFISLLSYNSTGWNSFKSDFIKRQLDPEGTNILAVQEHFRLKQNLSQLSSNFPKYELFPVPAVKSSDQIRDGRPSGGLAFLYTSNLSKCVTRILCPNSSRVQGIKLDLKNESLMIINAYFPCDNRNRQNDDLTHVLQDVKYILN